MSDKNILESITPVELLMAADIEDITEKEWAEALDACVADLKALDLRKTVSYTARLLAEWNAHILRCYVARARKAAHTGVRPMAVSPFTSEDLARLSLPGSYAALKTPPAQQPVIPANGRCWVKRPNRLGGATWVICCNGEAGPFVQSAPIRKHGDKWVEERWLEWLKHDTLEQAMLSLEKANCGQVLPKPADENTPWIVLTAEGKLELERVVKFEARRIPDPLAALFRDNLADAWAPKESPLKPWKERPEDLYWFRSSPTYHLLDRKDPDRAGCWLANADSREACARIEKDRGFPPLPVVRTSGYWLLREDDKYCVTVDGEVYVADGPNHAVRIEKENNWPSMSIRFSPWLSADRAIAAADAKDAEGWSWVLNHPGRYDLLYRHPERDRVSVKGQAWLARIAGIWGVSAPDITSKIIGTQEEAMLALEKHYNLPKLNRP